MIRPDDKVVMRAIALCYKPLLKPEEAEIYLNVGPTELSRKMEEKGIAKTKDGYYKKEDLDFIAGLHEVTRLKDKINNHMKRIQNKLHDKYNGF